MTRFSCWQTSRQAQPICHWSWSRKRDMVVGKQTGPTSSSLALVWQERHCGWRADKHKTRRRWCWDQYKQLSSGHIPHKHPSMLSGRSQSIRIPSHVVRTSDLIMAAFLFYCRGQPNRTTELLDTRKLADEHKILYHQS